MVRGTALRENEKQNRKYLWHKEISAIRRKWDLSSRYYQTNKVRERLINWLVKLFILFSFLVEFKS